MFELLEDLSFGAKRLGRKLRWLLCVIILRLSQSVILWLDSESGGLLGLIVLLDEVGHENATLLTQMVDFGLTLGSSVEV